MDVSGSLDGVGVDTELDAARVDFERAAQRARSEIAAALFTGGARSRRIADRYLLGAKIGAGGQGSVWRAHDTELGRDVAIKVLHLVGDAVPVTDWLRREARMLGRLAHPSVVRVFDLGLDLSAAFDGAADDGQALFVVMELVPGLALDRWLGERSRTPAEILAVMTHVAEGLAAVHAAGLVHCDVKPSNILVDDRGGAKLGDFGLAHAASSLEVVTAVRAGAEGMSVFGSTIFGDAATAASKGPRGGTPRYAAPEQLAGGTVDARADVYAFAVTLFEALHGRAPHTGGTVHALLEAKLAGPPELPAGGPLGRSAASMLARALDPDPQRRPKDVVELVDSLRRAERPRRGLWAMGAAFALGGLVLAAGTSDPCDAPATGVFTADDERAVIAALGADDSERWLVERVVTSMRAHDRAAIETREAACASSTGRVVTSCLDRNDAATRAAIEVLRTLDGRAPHRALAIVEGLADPRACARPDADPVVVGPAIDPDDPGAARLWAELSEARALERAGDSRGALDRVDALLAESGAESGAELGVLANEVALTRGNLLHTLGRWDEAVVVFEDLHRRADADGDALDAARAAVGLAFAIGAELKRVDEGLTWVRHGEAQLRRVVVPTGVAADLANAEGAILFMGGQHDLARVAFDRALVLAEGGKAGRLRSIRENVAIMKVIAGEPDAIAAMTAVHDELVAELGRAHPDSIHALANLGNALARSGRLHDGRERLEEALVLREAAFGTDNVDNARILCQLAELDGLDGDPDAALAHLRAATDLRERWLPEDHPDRADGVLQLAELLLGLGDIEGASRVLERHADGFAAAFAPTHTVTHDFLHARGVVALRRGRPDDAARLLGEAIRGSTARGDDGDELPIWIVEAAQAELARGDRDAARAYVDRLGDRANDLPAPARVELDATLAALADRAHARHHGGGVPLAPL